MQASIQPVQPGVPLGRRPRIYLLSPAHTGGKRAGYLMREQAEFELAVRLRREGIPIGEAFAFLSGLYFRGKLAYVQAFAAPPAGVPGSFVITSGRGLVTPETLVTLDCLRELAGVPIDPADTRYREPLERTVTELFAAAGPDCDYVLLGSVATTKYLEPISAILGDRLLFPQEFAGRGDMSRGGLMLRCAAAGEPLTYAPVGNLTRHGPRPPKLIPRRWK
jgi:hypothetical protein